MGDPPAPRRIIPARAGFTRGGRPTFRGRWDHPRSRGVYFNEEDLNGALRGSSPLARGLRDHYPRARSAAGIIPARAGFTIAPREAAARFEDHPRSRGVYDRPTYNNREREEDHPRSRGVYTIQPTVQSSPMGSSPLARGLPRNHGRRVPGARIIPARAGFTHRGQRECRDRRDHPRSRGVYARAALTRRSLRGSSPLARGLQEGGLLGVHLGGIIPARAGFTRTAPGRERAGGDHPRSRGVYEEAARKTRPKAGSSPLARGLPWWRRRTRRRPGIIPARAGFTPSRWPACASAWDHPRSRGVYRADGDARHARLGSSPLARGLPGASCPAVFRDGIIPARAGFTDPQGRLRLFSGDHPRSRGVYGDARASRARPAGSSPLARGLQYLYARRLGRPWIIPARAGFTRGSPSTGR